jgi:hypothetical protein
MLEQLHFLVEHASEHCGPECPECVRIAQVRNWLLLPFQTNRSMAA